MDFCTRHCYRQCTFALNRDVLEVTFCPIHCTERCLQEYDTPRSSKSEYRSDRRRRSSSRLESHHTSDYCSTFRSSDHPRDNRSRDHRRSSSRLSKSFNAPYPSSKPNRYRRDRSPGSPRTSPSEFISMIQNDFRSLGRFYRVSITVGKVSQMLPSQMLTSKC